MPEASIGILVIDDSQVIRDLLTDFLTERGYQVVTAKDGQEGIDTALDGDFQVVFCDLHMPRRNGYQVLKAVSEEKPDMRFIMTDSMPDELAERAAVAGAAACLLKPFDLDELLATLQALLNESPKNV